VFKNRLLLKRRLNFALRIILIVVLSFLALFFTSEYFANLSVRFDLANMPYPNPEDKILILAPHNDDEVLSSAGYIKKCKEVGAQVKVVFITNGDGFLNSAEIYYKRIGISAEEYISFGELRQRESVDTLKKLNVPNEDILFLGYPDGGIRNLLLENWSNLNLYKSAYTKSSYNPYPIAYQRGASYCGEALLANLSDIFEKFGPTKVIMPHPNDRHPDHWSTRVFATMALNQLKMTNVEQYLYLVHRGDWPTPLKKETDLYLVPPLKLEKSGTSWLSLDLSASDILLKSNVIDNYKTQKVILGPLMDAFKRKNELFGIIHEKTIKPLQQPFLSESNLIITDPVKDTITHQLNKGTDILGIYGAFDSNKNLTLAIRSDGPIDKDISYKIYLLRPAGSNVGYVVEMKNKKCELVEMGSKKPSISLPCKVLDSKTLSTSIPLSNIAMTNKLIIGAITYENGKITDTTAFLVFK